MACTEKDWLNYWLEFKTKCPNMDTAVIVFIRDFLYSQGIDGSEVIHDVFRSGYCWHFAHILKKSFGRGKVCLAAPFGHMVWVDDNDIPYDIEGVYTGECLCFIAEEELGTKVEDFMHVPGKTDFSSKVDIQRLMLKHGYGFNGVVYKTIDEIKDIEDKNDMLKSMCGIFDKAVLNLLPVCWEEFDFELLLSTIIDALYALDKEVKEIP